MAATTAPVAASGLVGGLTSVLANTASGFVPDGNFKALISIAAGLVAALIAFELISWLAVVRLCATRRALVRILPQFSIVQEDLGQVIARQVAIMKANNAPQQAIREVEREMNDLSANVVQTMAAITRKSLDIVRSLGS